MHFEILTLSFNVFFDKQVFLKGREINWKILVVDFIFWRSSDWGLATLPNMRCFKYFKGFCSDLYYFNISRHFRLVYFPEYFSAASSNSCKVFKILISTKIIYSGQKTRDKENRRRLDKRCGLIILGYFKHVIYFIL